MNPNSQAGGTYPIGATVCDGGVNFSIYSRNATAVELLFFDHEDDATPSRVIHLDPVKNRTYHYWHEFVPGVLPGQLYGYRVHGPMAPEIGLRFDSDKVLLDPYGRAIVVPKNYDRMTSVAPGDNTATAMKSAVVDPSLYDWEGDEPLQLPSSRTVIYELHVRGFTRHPNSGVVDDKRGTYAGLVEKVPYLKALGITAVELLPVFQFDAQDCPPGKTNYWGYAPVSFFAPHHAYSSRQGALGPVDEFRDVVKALHRAGIEVILDVVFNHTAEGDERGPTLCFRGVDNLTYYTLENNGARYSNYSGCGNTLNANQPIVRRMIVDSLKYWVEQMHVDGFRFDLASVLSRDANGQPLPNPPVLWDIESDPVLAGTKLIAEAWDAAGLYQVGSFVGDAWREWNGRFRDDVRDFVRGQPGSQRRVADRIVGSPEIFGHSPREAEQSVNFVTCHDGFTLNDLVSYNAKHNEANGEDNRDGSNDNRSWNCGIEGPTDDPAVEMLRQRQVKNFLTVTMMSLGIPMILMGDECRRTQCGNNNAYCHDNEISWFDWSLVEKHADIHRFVSLLCLRREMWWPKRKNERITLSDMLRDATKAWHGTKLNQPDWSDDSHSLALGFELRDAELRFHIILNAFCHPLDFELPRLSSGNSWRCWVDTSQDSPKDITLWDDAPLVSGFSYRAADRSMAILYARIVGDEI